MSAMQLEDVEQTIKLLTEFTNALKRGEGSDFTMRRHSSEGRIVNDLVFDIATVPSVRVCIKSIE